MKKIFTLILSVAMAGALNAQTIAPKVAAQKAAGIFQKSSAAKGMASTAVAEPELAYTAVLNRDTCFYVFNNPQGGYAIIGGDLVAREVLATVDAGSFDINKIPGNMKYMLDEYAQRISAAKGSYTTATSTWTCGADVTESLMSTHWTQDYPYNALCPDYDEYDCCATGCVATAAAQAVYKALKGKFTTGKKSKTYKHTVVTASGKKTVTQTYDATAPIVWDMKDTYDENDESDQALNVAYLMQIMGIISQMEYGEESGASSETLRRGLYNNIGIAAKYMSKEDEGMSDQEWEKFIYAELAEGRPVIMGADTPDSKGGHEFVIDGYKQENDNFHVNWGWGAKFDGYFALTGTIAKAHGTDGENKGDGSWMFPTSQGTGGSGQQEETAKNSSYRNGHEIVYNLVMRNASQAKALPEIDLNTVTINQGSQNAAKGAAITSEEENIPTIYVGDDSEETLDYVMNVSFGSEGIIYDGENAKFVWGVILEPVFEEGQEPDEYDCPILDATNGQDEPVEYKVGDVIYGFTIPVGEYAWNATGKAEEEGEEDPYMAGKYSVTPIMYFDADGDSEYISEENIVYVGTPYGWSAPVANFVLGKKPTTAIKSVETSAKESAKVTKVIRKNHIVLEKDGKQFDAAGARLN